MNDVLKAIAERNSCRDFTGEPLSKEQVDTLVKAALAAPSAMNKQPWRIIMCTDKSLLDEMDAESMRFLSTQEDKSFYNSMMERGGKVFYNAPGMLIALTDGSMYAACDGGILIQNVALAAHSMGLGNVICGLARFTFQSPKGEEFKKRLKFPSGYDFGISILVGAAKSGKEPHELDMGKVIYV